MEKRLRHEGNKTFRNEAIEVFMTEKNIDKGIRQNL